MSLMRRSSGEIDGGVFDRYKVELPITAGIKGEIDGRTVNGMKRTANKAMLKVGTKGIGLAMKNYLSTLALSEDYADDDKVMAKTDDDIERDFKRFEAVGMDLADWPKKRLVPLLNRDLVKQTVARSNEGLLRCLDWTLVEKVDPRRVTIGAVCLSKKEVMQTFNRVVYRELLIPSILDDISGSERAYTFSKDAHAFCRGIDPFGLDSDFLSLRNKLSIVAEFIIAVKDQKLRSVEAAAFLKLMVELKESTKQTVNDQLAVAVNASPFWAGLLNKLAETSDTVESLLEDIQYSVDEVNELEVSIETVGSIILHLKKYSVWKEKAPASQLCDIRKALTTAVETQYEAMKPSMKTGVSDGDDKANTDIAYDFLEEALAAFPENHKYFHWQREVDGIRKAIAGGEASSRVVEQVKVVQACGAIGDDLFKALADLEIAVGTLRGQTQSKECQDSIDAVMGAITGHLMETLDAKLAHSMSALAKAASKEWECLVPFAMALFDLHTARAAIRALGSMDDVVKGDEKLLCYAKLERAIMKATKVKALLHSADHGPTVTLVKKLVEVLEDALSFQKDFKTFMVGKIDDDLNAATVVAKVAHTGTKTDEMWYKPCAKKPKLLDVIAIANNEGSLLSIDVDDLQKRSETLTQVSACSIVL